VNFISVLGTKSGNYYESINGENFKHWEHFLGARKSVLFPEESFKDELLSLTTASKSPRKGMR
jgi:hypothetical protein